MAGEEPEVRKKHHRSSEDGAEEGSKRRKHSHHHRSHRHHHHRRHRSSKPDDETKHEEQDLEISSPQREIPPIVAPNSNSITRLDDDKEEGEILDEEDYGVANGELAKKKEDSDVESGEIKFEAFEELEHRNPRVRDEDDEEDNSSGRRKETELEIVLPLENDTVSISPANRRGDTEFVIQGVSDGKDAKEMRDEVDISKYLRIEHSVSSEKDYETGETDTESGKLRDSKGVRQHRDRTSRRANGVSHRSRKGDKRTERLSVSPLQKREMEVNNRNIESRHGRSRSPDHEEDVDLRKHQRVDDIDFEGLDIVRHAPRKHSESVDIERRSYGDRRKSVSPESMGDKFPTVDHSPYHHRNHEGDKARKRSRSRDHARERRSQSRSYLQDDRVHHMDLDYRSRTDSSSRMESLASREKARNEYDHPRVVRHDREDRHVTRDWARDRDRERERSSSYSRYGRREDRHGSRDPREKERERESDKNRDRDKGRGIDNDRHRDSGRDRNRERERDNLNLDGYRDSRRSQLSEQGYHHDRRSKYQSNDLEEGEDNLKRDADEQEDYEEKVELKLASEEEDIARIKEESRKRREAILEKYRRQNHEKQGERQYEDSEIETKDSLASEKPIERGSPVKVELSSAPEGPAGRNNGSEECDAVPMFAIGKSPLQNGPVAFERAPGTGGLGDGTPKSERSEDMFCDDIFGESPAGVRKAEKGEGLQIERSGLNDNWDDADGYYIYRFGELLDGRYEITAAHGKGVFSSVVRAKDLKAAKGEPEEVAIKIIRNNETMYKTGLEELVILKKLVGADPEDRRHCVRYISSFKYRNHLCLVFESLHMNLREVLKKFGRNIGLSLKAVREYAKQLFVSLKHLRNCGVLHCDIKPDNMLVSESKRVLKLCDFGNAMFAGRNEITPYLVSRFYRAPEIILGLTYDHPMDIWSVGCCLYELYSGKVLFPGPTNNDMLRLHMELKGPFPKKMLRKGAFTDQHFDNDLNFCAEEVDPVTKKIVKRLLSNIKPKDFSAIITGSPGEDPKMLANFKDLLEKIFVLDPEKRVTVSQALNHPFITGK